MTRSMTTASMVLENLQKELGSLELAGADPGVDEDAKLTIGEAVQLIANGTVIGAVAEDMLKKLKTGGVRSGIPRRYVVTYELYGLLTNKVRDVLDQMDEISQTEVEQADLAVKMQAAGNIDASSIARAVGREDDEDFITKLKAADTVDTAPDPDESEMDQQEQIVGEMDKLLTREELKNLLTDVISGLDRFRWQDLANDLKKWCTTGETSDNVVRRLLEDTVELQREAVSVLALSKILAEETLSSRILLAARALADFNDAVDREMGLMLERFGIDPALISRTYTHSASLLDAFASKKSLSSLDREEETDSGLADSQPFATTANLSDMEKAMVKQRDHQRRVHKKVKGDLTALMQEHRRKVELNSAYAVLCRYDHLMMTTMRDERRGKGGQECSPEPPEEFRQPTYESQELEVDELETPPDMPPEEDAAENVASKPAPALPGRLPKGKASAASASQG
ncbi:URC1, partial [Symbiodinium necroappetens]